MTQSVVCGECGTAVAYGRLSCPECGELLATVAGVGRRSMSAASSGSVAVAAAPADTPVVATAGSAATASPEPSSPDALSSLMSAVRAEAPPARATEPDDHLDSVMPLELPWNAAPASAAEADVEPPWNPASATETELDLGLDGIMAAPVTAADAPDWPDEELDDDVIAAAAGLPFVAPAVVVDAGPAPVAESRALVPDEPAWPAAPVADAPTWPAALPTDAPAWPAALPTDEPVWPPTSADAVLPGATAAAVHPDLSNPAAGTPGAYVPPAPASAVAPPPSTAAAAPARAWAGHGAAPVAMAAAAVTSPTNGRGPDGPVAVTGSAAEPATAGVIDLTQASEFVGWLAVAGSLLAIVGFLLPWSSITVIGASGVGYLDRWGLAGPWHILVVLGVGGMLAAAILRDRVPMWAGIGLPGLGLGALLLGLVWPYLIGPLGGSLGAMAVALGAVMCIGAGIAALVVDRHARSEPGV